MRAENARKKERQMHACILLRETRLSAPQQIVWRQNSDETPHCDAGSPAGRCREAGQPCGDIFCIVRRQGL